MPKNHEPEFDLTSPEAVAAQRAVFEGVVKAGEAYAFALIRALFWTAQNGADDVPSEISSPLNTHRKTLLDILQHTLVK